jgi:hypothetical protein
MPKRRPAPPASSRKIAARKTAERPARGKAPVAAAKVAARPRPAARKLAPPVAREVLVPSPFPIAGLSEEDQIRQAKYLPRELPPRLFEEERFLFPETYEVDRLRLLVKDPEWVFAYWDVNPRTLEGIGRSLGERSMALARLTLRVFDPNNGGSTDVLLPEGTRWWYVRTDTAARSYRAELGLTLPSGEFRRLAESNVVTSPRLGPSAARARTRVSARGGAATSPAGGRRSSGGGAAGSEAGEEGAPGPWNPPPMGGSADRSLVDSPERSQSGGASDTFRPGASDAFHR